MSNDVVEHSSTCAVRFSPVNDCGCVTLSREEVERVLRRLGATQWIYIGSKTLSCPACGGVHPNTPGTGESDIGHVKGCEHAAAIKSLEEKLG